MHRPGRTFQRTWLLQDFDTNRKNHYFQIFQQEPLAADLTVAATVTATFNQVKPLVGSINATAEMGANLSSPSLAADIQAGPVVTANLVSRPAESTYTVGTSSDYATLKDALESTTVQNDNAITVKIVLKNEVHTAYGTSSINLVTDGLFATDNLVIEGQGQQDAIIGSTAKPIIRMDADSRALRLEDNGVSLTFRDIEIDGNGYKPSSAATLRFKGSYNTIENVVFTGFVFDASAFLASFYTVGTFRNILVHGVDLGSNATGTKYILNNQADANGSVFENCTVHFPDAELGTSGATVSVYRSSPNTATTTNCIFSTDTATPTANVTDYSLNITKVSCISNVADTGVTAELDSDTFVSVTGNAPCRLKPSSYAVGNGSAVSFSNDIIHQTRTGNDIGAFDLELEALASDVSSSGTLAGNLTRTVGFAANVAGSGTLVGNVEKGGLLALAADVVSSATLAADLTRTINFNAALSGAATVAAELVGSAKALAADITGSAQVTADYWPTTIYTVGSDPGDDYTTIGNCIAAFAAITDASHIVVELRGETHNVGSQILSSHVSNLSVTFRPMSGAAHEGDPNRSGAAIINCSTSNSKTFRQSSQPRDIFFQDIVFDLNTNPSGSGSFELTQVHPTTTWAWERCIFIEKPTTTTFGQWAIVTTNPCSSQLRLYSCLFYKNDHTGSSGNSGFIRLFSNTEADVVVNHMTVHDIDGGPNGANVYGFSWDGTTGQSTAVYKNCIVSEVTGSGGATYECIESGSGVTVTDCLTSDTTGTITNEAGTTTFVDPDNATLYSRNYALRNGSLAIGGGTALGTSQAHRRPLGTAWYLDGPLRPTTGDVDLGALWDGSLRADITGSATVVANLTTSTALAADLTGSATLAGSLDESTYLAADLSANGLLVGELTVTGGVTEPLAADITGASTVGGNLTRTIGFDSSLTGSGLVTGDLTRTIGFGSSLTGSGLVTGDLTRTIDLSAAMDGSGQLTGDSIRTRNLDASLTGSSTLVADLTRTVALAVDLVGSATLTGTIEVGITQLSANVVGSGELVSGLTYTAALTADLVGSATLTGNLTRTVAISADLVGTAELEGTIEVGVTQLAANVTGEATAVGNLTRTRDQDTGISGSGILTGNLTRTVAISADLVGTGELAATIEVGITQLTANLAGVSTVGGDLTRTVAVAAPLLASGTVEGDLSRTAAIAASVVGTGACTANLTRTIALSADLTGEVSLSATIEVGITQLVAHVSGTGQTVADLTRTIGLTAELPGAAEVTAILGAGPLPLVADLTGSGELDTGLIRIRSLSPTLTGNAILTAELSENTFISTSIITAGNVVADLSRTAVFQAAYVGSATLVPDLSTYTLISTDITGAAVVSPNLIRKKTFESSVSGSGDVQASLDRTRSLQASLAGSGNLIAAIGGLVDMAVSVEASGTVLAGVRDVTFRPWRRTRHNELVLDNII